MESYTFRVIIEPEQDGGYHGFVPLLRGVHTGGDSLEEVKKNLKEAIRCHVQGLLKDNWLRDGRRITVPIHEGKDLNKKILSGIIGDLEISVEEFIELL